MSLQGVWYREASFACARCCLPSSPAMLDQGQDRGRFRVGVVRPVVSDASRRRSAHDSVRFVARRRPQHDRSWSSHRHHRRQPGCEPGAGARTPTLCVDRPAWVPHKDFYGYAGAMVASPGGPR